MSPVEHLTLTIEAAYFRETGYGPDEEGLYRLCLDFAEGDKVLIGSSTLYTLTRMLGDNLLTWQGKEINLAITIPTPRPYVSVDADGVGAAFASGVVECDGEREF